MRLTFPTALGRCALVWEGDRLLGSSLPDAAALADDAPVTSALPPPAWIGALIARMQAHLAGQRRENFRDVPFAWERVGAWQRRVYEIALCIPAGQTRSYGELAAALGEPPAAARAVGAALGANPWPPLVPCHRIIASDGRLTGFSGPGGVAQKARLLQLEGALLIGA